MNKIIIATSNQNKVKEIKAKFEEQNIDINVELIGQGFDPVEDGKTFLENAYIKAYEAAKMTGETSLADDSGLVVEALAGQPGIHSARYADTAKSRIEKVLSELKKSSSKNRKAYFACALVLVSPSGEKLFEFEAKCHGSIIDELKGSNGFGYDPIFFINDLNKTMAELTLSEKNQYSHRSIALKEFINWYKSQ